MPLKAGVGVTDVTPPVGVELCGYGFYLERRSTGVLDRLKARALVLEANGKRLAIIACDLIGLSRDTVRETRAAMERETGIPGAHVMLACSHTHAGPATLLVRGCGEMDEGYVAGLPERLAAAMREAAGALQEARVGFAVGEAVGLAHNRVEGEAGPLDTGLVVMRVIGGDGEPLATVYNVSAHGVTLFSRNTLISADWPGAASRRIALQGGEALFLTGSNGDVNPVLAHTGRHQEAGALVAGRVLELADQVQYTDDIALRAVSQDIALPLQVIPAEELQAVAEGARKRLALPDGPEHAYTRSAARMELGWAEEMLAKHKRGEAPQELRTEVQALRVGEGLFLAHGAELFCEYGIDLKARFAPRPTFVVGYANDLIGYVPDPEDYARAGYAAATVPKMLGTFPYTTDVGARLTAALEAVGEEAPV